MTAQSYEPQAAYYPIRVVSNETGVNAITLRAWERRYGLITPKRTEKGHRLYTEDDIRLIKQVVALLNRGIPISQARAMLDHSLATPTTIGRQPQPSQWHQYREQLTQAVNDFDDAQLASIFDEVSQFFPIDIALRFLLMPIYNHLTENVTQALGVARLRFYAGFLQARLAWRLAEPSDDIDGPSVLVANGSQDDEISLLLMAILLKQLSLRPIWFSGWLSCEHSAELMQQQGWQAALMQLPASPSDQQLTQLAHLIRETGKPIFVLGQSSSLNDRLRKLGAICLGDDLQQSALNVRDLLTDPNL